MTLSGHLDSVSSVAFSPDSRTLASCSHWVGGTVWLWDVDSGELKTTLSKHSDSVHSVAFSPDGRTLASGGKDGTVCLWDVATAAYKTTLSTHTRSVSSLTKNSSTDIFNKARVFG